MTEPRAAPRAALAAIGQLADAEIDIGNAALQLARVDAPDADWKAAARHLSDLAQGAVTRAVAMDREDLPAGPPRWRTCWRTSSVMPATWKPTTIRRTPT